MEGRAEGSLAVPVQAFGAVAMDLGLITALVDHDTVELSESDFGCS
jgi:hypothetical protein